MRTLTRSFAGGEITPELYGRIDLTKFQTGLAQCENMIVLPHGPVSCRPGFEYVLQTKTPTDVRLIPFSFNTEQTYVIELGVNYMRFHTNGATVLAASQVVTSITKAAQAVLTYGGADTYANGGWVYLSDTDTAAINGRFCIVSDLNAGTNTFKLKDLRGNYINTNGWAADATGGTVASVYEVVTTYAAADLFDLNFVQSADVMTLTHINYAPRTLSRLSATTFSLAVEAFAPTSTPPTAGLTATPNAAGAKTYQYKVTALAVADLEESVASANISTGATAADLATAGNYVTVAWTTTGAARYNIYKEKDGVYGYIGQSALGTFKDDNIIPDYSLTPPENQTPFATDFPGAVSYHEQRKIFGSTALLPLNFWMTRSGTESNMSRSIPVRADDAIRGKMVAREVNEIRHFVPLSELLVLTSGAEWVIAPTDAGALTALTSKLRPQSYVGCAKSIPQITGNSVLFNQANKKRLYEIAYSWENSAYKASDISIMAPHLVDDYTIIDTAYARSPDQIHWETRSDGVLLGTTYVPEHEVIGWHKHTSPGGLFKSVCVVSEGNRYALYAVVARTINGDAVQYIERLHDRSFTALEDWFGVDAGSTYSGAAADTISGLWHLEGETVEVLADGAVVSGLVVTEGTVTLPAEAAKVHIGIGYTPIVRPLPASFQAEAGGAGRMKNINSLYMRVNKTCGLQAGRTLDSLHTYPQRSTEPYGSPPGMVTGMVQIEIDGPWDEDGDFYLTRTGPLPMTLVSVSAEIEIGD